jgi:hypothetical protein
VDVVGDTAVIGAFGADCSEGFDCGAVYIFTRSETGWVQQAKLTASDAAGSDFFGSAIAIDGETIIVGAAGVDCPPAEDCGAAYIFTHNETGWSQQAKLTATDGTWSDFFGSAVAIEGDTAIVGAYGVNCADGTTECGAAYLFTRTGSEWSQQARLAAASPAADDMFGWAVDIEAETAIIGAPGDDCCGAAYIFTGSGSNWSQQARLTAADGAVDDQFGTTVAIEGDTVVVGAPGSGCAAGAACGASYLFTGNAANWDQHAKLTAGDATADDRFGTAVAFAGDMVVVGAPGAWCVAGPTCGAAYVFTLNDEGTSQQAIASIVADVQSLVDSGALNQGQASGLINKLNQAIARLDQAKPELARNRLQAFVQQVNAFVAAGVLTAAEGQPLIDAAGEVIASLE